MKKILELSFLFFSLIFKVLCFCVLFYQSVIVTVDYLNFPTIVKFEVKSDRKYFKLPAIQLCTGTNIFLDRNKLMAHFNLTEEFSTKYENLRNQYNEQLILCEYSFSGRSCVSKLTTTFDRAIFRLDKLIFKRIGYKQIKEKISQIIISAKDYIRCSGEVHTENGYRKEVIDDCEKYSEVIQSIHVNDFGVCLTYFSDRKSLTNSSFTLKDDDFIEFVPNFKNLNNILFLTPKRVWLKWLIRDSNTFIIPKQENIIKTYMGYSWEFKYTRNTVKHLSWPYESDCHNFDSKFC